MKVIKTAEATGLVALAEGKRWLAQARDLLEVKDFCDKAAAVEHYLKQRDDAGEAAIDAAELRLRAERRLGELLAETVDHKGGRPAKNPITVIGLIPDGINQNQSTRYQQAAKVPEEQFEAHIEEARAEGNHDKLTSVAVRRLASEAKKTKQRDTRKSTRLEKLNAAPNTNGSIEQAERPWQVIHGDCVKVLPVLPASSVRLVFADPPYNQGVDYGDGTKADRLPDDEHERWALSWLESCRHVLSPDGSLWVLISDEYAAEYVVWLKRLGFTLRNWVIWSESFGVQCEGKFARLKRHLLYFTVSSRDFVFNSEAMRVPSARQTVYGDSRADPRGKVMGDVWTDIPRLAGTHGERIPSFPTQLPVALPSRVIACASEEGDMIVDPFSGSATTGIAAIRLHRQYTGIEKQEEFARLSIARLQGEPQ